jgi:Tol biopolymer transport system component
MLALAACLPVAPAAAQVTRVSVATDGSQANGASTRSAVSGNGKFVVFSSSATNLVTGDTNGVSDVFVRDLAANVTTRVSVASDGTPGTQPSGLGPVAISDDGNIVAFESMAPLVPEDTNLCLMNAPVSDPCGDIYVHDRSTGVTTRVSVGTDGAQGDNRSWGPSLSADGRYVVFNSHATTLVPGDTNGYSDVFVHDRVAHTTTRVSVTGIVQGASHSRLGVISADGQTVAFTAPPANFGDEGFVNAEAVFVRTSGGGLRRLPEFPAPPNGLPAPEYRAMALSADGSRLIVLDSQFQDRRTLFFALQVYLCDLSTNQISLIASTSGLGLPPAELGVALAADGRFLVASSDATTNATNAALKFFDTKTNLSEPGVKGTFPSLSSTGRFMTFVSTETDLVAGDTNAAADIFLLDRDQDGDGMPSSWETQFGLNPNDPADAAADPDSDGLTNLQEFTASSHPTATHTRYFAEGAANAFFYTRVAVANPNADPANVMLRFAGSNGAQTSTTRIVPANSRTTFTLALPIFMPDSAFSTLVESDRPVVADRLMTWDGTRYGSSLETSTAAPGKTWYLAEGATGSSYSLYYLLQNPGDADSDATVTYLLPTPQAPITKTYQVPAHSRFTIDVRGEAPALSNAEVSAKITSTQPLVVERALYMSTPSQPFAAGHDGAGIAAPATRWFLAEGATGFFDEYVLIANANAGASDITVTYLLEAGQSFTESFPVAANSRYTIDVKSRDSRLLSTPVSVIVESTNSVPVVVERAMWWPHGNWYEASLSAGVTAAGTKWAFAEGEKSTTLPGGRTMKTQTYVLIANTDPAVDGTATITLLREADTPLTTTVPIPANRRTSVDLAAAFPGLADGRYGIIVESSGVPIVAERALYSTIDGVTFAAGATSVGTNLTPVP